MRQQLTISVWVLAFAVCFDGYYKSRAGKCLVCSGNAELMIALGVVVGVIVVCVALIWVCCATTKEVTSWKSVNESRESFFEALSQMETKVKILISTLQVQSKVGAVYAIHFPNTFNTVLRYFNALSLDFVHLMPLECMIPTNFHVELQMRTLVPLGLMLILSAGAAICMRCRFWNKKERMVTLIFLVFFFAYPSTSSAIFSTFQCETLDDGNQTRVLRADFAIDCDSDAHQGMVGYAAFMIIVYPVGLPLMFALMFCCNIEQLMELVEQRREVAADAVRQGKQTRRLSAVGKLKAAEKDMRLPNALQRAVGPYDNRYFFYEIFECVRKLLLVCMPVFFDPPGSVAQLIFGLMCSVLSIIVLCLVQPYKLDSDNALALLGEVSIFFCMLASIVDKYDEQALADSRNMDALLTFLLISPFALVLLQMGIEARASRTPPRILPPPPPS